MGVVSLVLGIVGVVVALFGGAFNWIAVIIGVIGIILGAKGRNDTDGKGVATAGMVLSILALVFGIAMYVACASCIGLASLASY